jgi:hypothetical protein
MIVTKRKELTDASLKDIGRLKKELESKLEDIIDVYEVEGQGGVVSAAIISALKSGVPSDILKLVKNGI